MPRKHAFHLWTHADLADPLAKIRTGWTAAERQIQALLPGSGSGDGGSLSVGGALLPLVADYSGAAAAAQEAGPLAGRLQTALVEARAQGQQLAAAAAAAEAAFDAVGPLLRPRGWREQCPAGERQDVRRICALLAEFAEGLDNDFWAFFAKDHPDQAKGKERKKQR